MNILDIFKEKHEAKVVTMSFRLTKNNKEFLDEIKNVAGKSRNSILNKFLEYFREEYKNNTEGDLNEIWSWNYWEWFE